MVIQKPWNIPIKPANPLSLCSLNMSFFWVSHVLEIQVTLKVPLWGAQVVMGRFFGDGCYAVTTIGSKLWLLI